MKRILIVGGTRFFGRILVSEMLAAGHQVSVLTRGNRASSHVGVECLTCDRKDEAALTETLAGREFDVVVDNICYQPQDAEMAVRVFSGRCRRYIFTSSVMSYLDSLAAGRPLREEEWGTQITVDHLCPPYASSEVSYALGKHACERVFLGAPAFDPVIFRLQNVVGEDDFSGKSSALPLDIIRSGAIHLRPAAADTYQFMYAADLGPLYNEALDTTRIPTGAYNVAATPLTVAECVAMAQTAAGRSCSVSLGQSGAPQGPFPHNVSLDTSLLHRTFQTRLSEPADFLPRVFRWSTQQAALEGEA